MPDSAPTESTRVASPAIAGPDPAGHENDPLAGFEAILAGVAHRDRQAEDRSAHERDVTRQFLDEFTAVCASEVRPAMQAVIEQLRTHGGAGVIDDHPGGEARYRNPSVIMWMSLEGDIHAEPRPDREPYLQLEADTSGHEVQIFEGDMWRGAGGNRSGRVGTWQLSEVTHDRIVQELLDIARRAAA